MCPTWGIFEDLLFTDVYISAIINLEVKHMDTNTTMISIQSLIYIACAITGIWGFIKIIMEIVKSITARHDRERGWDKAVEDINKGRIAITEEFNQRLNILDTKIDENHTETEAKMQELTALVIMITKSIKAVLDGQIEQGLNGEVKKQRDELDTYLTSLIGK